MIKSEISETLKYYGAMLTDTLYEASLLAVLAFGGSLAMLMAVGAAVAMGAVDVPEFHPK